jgi:superkiller protein 3
MSTDENELAAETARLRQQCEAQPNQPDHWLELGKLQLFQGNAAEARACLEKALRLSAEGATFYWLGNVAVAEEDFSDAAAWFEKACQRDPEQPAVHGGLGYALYRLGHLQRAKPHLLLAAEADPADEMTHMALAKIAAAEGDFAQTIERCLHVLRNDPSDAKSPALLVGDAYLGQGDFERAAGAYTVARDLDPQDPVVLAGLAQLHMILGHMELAEDELKQSLALNAQCADAHLAYGNLCLARSEPQAARGHFERALAADPKKVPVYGVLAMTLILLERVPEARAVARKGLDLDPTNVDCLLALAQVAELERRYNETARLAERALKYIPRHPHAHLLLARAEIALRRDALRAKRHLELAHELAPNADFRAKVETLQRALRAHFGLG